MDPAPSKYSMETLAGFARRLSGPAGRGLFFVLVLANAWLFFLPFLLWSFSGKWFYPDLFPEKFSLRAWEYVFYTAGNQILPALGNSLGVAAAAAAGSVAVGIPAGRVLGLYAFPGKTAAALMLGLPVIVPPLCVSMGLHFWFIRLGLAETFSGVVLVHLTFCAPYAVFVMWGVFSNFNLDYEEQARSLGAGFFRVFFRVTLPLIFPGVVVAALFSFLLSWSQYVSTLIIGGGQVATLPILLFSLVGAGDRPVAAAVSLLFIAPALGVLLVSARRLGGKIMAGIW